MIENPIFITDNAVLNIYIIGYKTMGESILFEISDSKIEKSLYGIIDCYKENGLNYTFDFLKTQEVKELYFLLWSHPDRDHSLGLNDIITYFGNKIKLLGISDGISFEEINSSNKKQKYNDVEKVYIEINNISQKLGQRFIHINHATKEFKIPFIKENGEKIYFTIKPFAPLCNIVRNERVKLFRDMHKNTKCLKNRISTGFLITLGDYDLCFAGDITNEGLVGDDYKKFLTTLFKNIDFVKIPHHGSKNSETFLQLLPKNFSFAGLTKFNSTTPNPEIVSKYKNRTNVLATFPMEKQIKEYEHSYGVVKLTIPFNHINYIEYSFEGNACKL